MKKNKQLFSGTKALVVILGVHGGGVANAKWLYRNGANVTVTDERSVAQLAPSIAAFSAKEQRAITFTLGGQREQDFKESNLIVLGPGVDKYGKWWKLAHASGARVENDASLFFRFCKNPTIGVTGTRGKTTTTAWIAQLLQKKYKAVRPSGNTPENAFLKEFDRINGKHIPAVTELSSWQLELLPVAQKAPHIAMIMNLFPDHLNRYKGIRDYADAKANIMVNQTTKDFLILNCDNEWFDYFAKKKRKSKLLCVSQQALPKGRDGIFVLDGFAVLRQKGRARHLFSVEKFTASLGAHNLTNMLAAVLAIHLLEPKLSISERDILKLRPPRMRQEIIATKGNLTIVNDSCATSPDGVVAAIERFRTRGNVVLITGGTDKELEFKKLAESIALHIPKDHLVLLEGSATTKLLEQRQMSRRGLDRKQLKNLDSCVREAFRVARLLSGNTTILFSPGAASFEKFLHEFDRGEQFNKLIKKYIK